MRALFATVLAFASPGAFLAAQYGLVGGTVVGVVSMVSVVPMIWNKTSLRNFYRYTYPAPLKRPVTNLNPCRNGGYRFSC
ncbi:hypothetical protein FJZ39_00935 [Candidatus Saccharibacteria bacterium]|nr:hypothetical protein [Candidatus Saccharibacteria bacterium]